MRQVVTRVIFGVMAAAMACPAVASSATQADAAFVRIYSGGASEIRMSGINGGKSTTKLCVASTSGRYRLSITSRSGSMVGPGQLPYEIIFRDGSGAEQSATITNAPQVHFDGVSPGTADCHSGPNAEIEIRLSKASVLKGVAGDYFDQLDLSVGPL
jgi:hypothetical protein